MSLLSISKLVGLFSAVIGLMIIGWWATLLLTNQVPELKPDGYAPRLIIYHVTAELLTGIVLIISGVGLLLSSDRARGFSAISLGMLLYTAINSTGKFSQEDNLPMVALFTVITILTGVAIVALFKFS